MLHNIFNRIQKNEFSTGADHVTQLKQIEQSFIGKIPVCFLNWIEIFRVVLCDDLIDFKLLVMIAE